MMRNRFSDARRHAPSLAAAIGFLLLTIWSASPALATLKRISVDPASPTTCDSISLTVTGELPDPCYEVVAATIRGPEQLPCVWPGPCPSRFWVEITVREPDPARTCPAVVAPYTRSFNVGILPVGEYLVAAREHIIPFSGDSTVSESIASAAFTVRPDSACSPSQGCYILDFSGSRDPIPATFCTATAPPGGTACLALTLMNTNAVGGLQTTINVPTISLGIPAGPFPHAVSVEPVGRAAGFQIGWTAEGSQTRILLYSTTPGASIPPGDGPLIRICYSIAPETVPQMFHLYDFPTIVADPAGEAFPPCPTFRATGGIICVSSTGCDVNGDGFSDVLDVIRLVRCALAAGNDSSEACPDSIAARADCNGDGSVDIRDVICCVRKIVSGLGSGEGFIPPPPILPGPGQGNTVGFEGSVRWINEVDGVAVVRIDAAEGWGGTQFRLDAQGAPVRIRGLKLSGADAALEWAADASGVVRAMLYGTEPGTQSARTYRVEVALERAAGSGTGALRLADLRAGTWVGAAAPVSSFNPTLQVAAVPVAAPALLGARPNPTSGVTEIGFVLPSDARVSLHVYDVAGRLVRTLIDGPLPAGVHRMRWDGKDDGGRTARSGLYFTKLEVGSTVRSERIMLLR